MSDARAQLYNDTTLNKREKLTIGAWIPSHLYLETMQGDKQVNVIRSLVSQGFNEYYFVMRDFNNTNETRAAEKLLNAADTTDLKIIIILLPLAEGGRHASYDWKGWMLYFNKLAEKHTSFLGFAIDDFNAVVDIRRVYLMNNMDLMELSNFSSALSYKRDDVQFYPVMYVETGEFETLKKEYDKYYKAVILVSTLYSNISHLGNDLTNLSKNLDNKPIKFIVYPTYGDFYSPSDRLLMATLSLTSRLADGIIVYRNTTHPVVQEYLYKNNDPKYMSTLRLMENLQIKNEILESRRDIVMCTFCLYQRN